MQRLSIKVLFLSVISSMMMVSIQLSYAQDRGNKLRVMTYNIHHANPPSRPDVIDLQAIAKVINAHQPDLVALQEVDVNNRRSGDSLNESAELGKLTGMHHVFVKAIDYGGGAYGVSILSKFPILQTDSLHLPMAEASGGEPRVLAIVTVAPKAGQTIKFACTHLDLKEQNRMLQANAIMQLLNSYTEPVILGGDFNAKPGSDVINHFDKYLKRSKVEGKAAYTIPEKNPNKEIDFIMYKPSHAFSQLEHQVIDEPYASDHLPVLVELGY